MIYAASGFSLASLISACVTLIIGLIIVKAVQKLVDKAVSATKYDANIKSTIVRAVKVICYIILLLIVASTLGVDTTSFVALASVATLGISLAAEDFIANLAGGLIILSTQPFTTGDYIEAAGVAGTVTEIHLHNTRLITLDGQAVIVPNKSLAGSNVVNYTVNGLRRVAVEIGTSYDAPAETVRAACLEAIQENPSVLQDPAPAVFLTGYGESRINYSMFFWVEPANYFSAMFAVREAVLGKFAKYGIAMTYDHINVHMIDK